MSRACALVLTLERLPQTDSYPLILGQGVLLCLKLDLGLWSARCGFGDYGVTIFSILLENTFIFTLLLFYSSLFLLLKRLCAVVFSKRHSNRNK